MPSKDAFLSTPPKAAEEGEPLSEGRSTNEWTRRLIVDGIEVDPATMKPLTPTEE